MNIIAGADEVGRGCLAGPLVAAVVVLDKRINLLKDSKLLIKEKREILSEKIKQKALDYGVGSVSAKEIDEVGLSEANRLAMMRALELITCSFDELIVDGSINYLSYYKNTRALIKADKTINAVSAASILAKVERDRYMTEQAKKYTDYGFEKHVGYGTRLHLDMIKAHGISELHRRSFAPVREYLTFRMPL